MKTVHGSEGNIPRRTNDIVANGVIVFLLWGFAVAQPLFDLLARGAEFFVVRRSGPGDILLLTAIVSILIPAVLTLLEWTASFFGVHVRRGLHLLVVTALLAAAGLVAGTRFLPFAGWVQAALALMVGAAGAALYARYPRSKESSNPTFLTLLALCALVFPANFLLNSSIFKLLLPANDVESRIARVDATTPVIMVIFDELSVVSLMNERRQVDPYRYPNFASLAQESTWYRNATTVSGYTDRSVPSILTGKYPKHGALPTAKDHSQNLFIWLGDSYDLNVYESFTHLCPADLCQTRVVRPLLTHRLATLLSELSLVYCHLLLPRDLSEDLPSIDTTWDDFWGRDSTKAIAPNEQDSWADARTAPFRHFLESLRPKASRVLHLAHLKLPHMPWQYLPSGQKYGPAGASLRPHGLLGSRWSTDPWHSTQAYQRYLLQLSFVDKLLGDLLDEVKKLDLFHQSLIIVTADHGISFRPGTAHRGFTNRSYPDILSVPLFIKYPRQDMSRIDDLNVQTIDIVPTIADVLGAELPWHADGKSILRRSPESDDKHKIFYRRDSKRGRVVDDDPEAKYAMLAWQTELFGTGADRGRLFAIGEFKDLIGHRVDHLDFGPAMEGRVELYGLNDFANVDLDGPTLPARIIGELRLDTMTGDVHLAVAVNGVVRAVTRSYREGNDARFSAMIPPNSLLAGSNRLELFAINTGIDGSPRLARVAQGREIYSLRKIASRNTETITTPDGRAFPVRQNALIGRIEWAAERNDMMKIRGWASDLKNAERPNVFVFFSDGEFFFAGRSNIYSRRADRKDGAERAMFAFALPMPLLSDAYTPNVRVFALSPRGYSSEMKYFPGYPWGKKSNLATKSGIEVLQTADGTSIPADSLDIKGRVEVASINDGFLRLRFWAVDIASCDSVENLAVFVNGQLLFEGAVHKSRVDVSEQYGEEEMRRLEYRPKIPLKHLEESEIREVRVFAISRRSTAAELDYPVSYPWNKYSLSTDGDDERLVSSAGRSIAIIQDAFRGQVQPARIGDSRVRIRGWIGDAAAVGVPTMVAVFADGEFLHADRAVVAGQHLVGGSGEEISRADFQFSIPRRLLPEPLDTELRIFAVSKSGYASELQLPPSDSTGPESSRDEVGSGQRRSTRGSGSKPRASGDLRARISTFSSSRQRWSRM